MIDFRLQHVSTVREREREKERVCDRLKVDFIKPCMKLWSDACNLSKDCQTETQYVSCGRTFSRQVSSLHNWRRVRSNPETCRKFGE